MNFKDIFSYFYFYFIKLFMLDDTPEGAIKYNNKILNFNPDFKKSWFRKAESFTFEKKYDEAIECYDEVLKREPLFFNAILGKAQSFQRKTNYKSSIKCLDKCIDIEPYNYYIFYLKAKSLHDLGEYEESIEIFDNLLNKFPNSVPVLFGKAVILSIYNDNENALKIYNKIINTPKNFKDPVFKGRSNIVSFKDLKNFEIDAHFNKGSCLWRMGDLEGAYYSKLEGLKLRPKDPFQLAACGTICYQLGHYDKAEEFYTKAMKYNTEVVEVWYFMGRIYEENKKYEEAIAFYKIVLDKDQDCINAKKRIKNLYNN